MARRVYYQSILKWMKRIGIPVGVVGAIFFVYLSMIGAITINGSSGDMVCRGTIDDPCYAFINFTANEDIYLYPQDYDPWGRNISLVHFDNKLKEWEVQRSWGDNWRTIYSEDTQHCTGSWCGCYWCRTNNTAKYAYAFRENRSYEIRIVGYKKDPDETIKWSFGFDKLTDKLTEGYVDPYWYGYYDENESEIEIEYPLAMELGSNAKISFTGISEPELCFDIDHPEYGLYLNNPIYSSLQTYYKLDETTGDVVDITGNGNDGTISGDPTRGVTGKINDAFEFDGSGTDNVNTGISTPSNGSLSMWVTTDVVNQTRRIVFNSGRSNWNIMRVGLSDTDYFKFALYDGDNKQCISTFTPNTGEWYHLVVSWGSEGMKLYINGELNATNPSYTGNGDANQPMYIGKITTQQSLWDGKIDEVGIWDRALNSTEVEELYNNGDALAYFTTVGKDFDFNIPYFRKEELLDSDNPSYVPMVPEDELLTTNSRNLTFQYIADTAGIWSTSFSVFSQTLYGSRLDYDDERKLYAVAPFDNPRVKFYNLDLTHNYTITGDSGEEGVALSSDYVFTRNNNLIIKRWKDGTYIENFTTGLNDFGCIAYNPDKDTLFMTGYNEVREIYANNGTIIKTENAYGLRYYGRGCTYRGGEYKDYFVSSEDNENMVLVFNAEDISETPRKFYWDDCYKSDSGGDLNAMGMFMSNNTLKSTCYSDYDVHEHHFDYADDEVYIPAHQYDEIINATINVTSFAYDEEYLKGVELGIGENSTEGISAVIGDMSKGTAQLDDDSKSKKVSLGSDKYAVEYISIPRTANVTSANINITGYKEEGLKESSVSDDSLGYINSINITNPENANDGIRNNYAYFNEKTGKIELISKINPAAGENVTGIKVEMYLGNFEDSYKTITWAIYNYSSSSYTNHKNWEFSYIGYPIGGLAIGCYDGCVNSTNHYQLLVKDYKDVKNLRMYEIWAKAYFYERFASNPYIEVGEIDGTKEWNYSGLYSSEEITADFSDEINSYLSDCSTYSCKVPIHLGADTGGTLEISDINIDWNYTPPNPVRLDTDKMQSYLNKSDGQTYIPINIYTENIGTIQVNDVNYDYRGGMDSIEVTAYEQGNATNNETIDISVFYTDWIYSLPGVVEYLEFIPDESTSKNVTPCGQSGGTPILNLTSHSYSGIKANFFAYLGGSLSCVELYLSSIDIKPPTTLWSNLLAYYTFDTQDAKDISGNNYDGDYNINRTLVNYTDIDANRNGIEGYISNMKIDTPCGLVDTKGINESSGIDASCAVAAQKVNLENERVVNLSYFIHGYDADWVEGEIYLGIRNASNNRLIERKYWGNVTSMPKGGYISVTFDERQTINGQVYLTLEWYQAFQPFSLYIGNSTSKDTIKNSQAYDWTGYWNPAYGGEGSDWSMKASFNKDPYPNGIRGYALEFGGNDHVSIPNIITEDFSISLWFKNDIEWDGTQRRLISWCNDASCNNYIKTVDWETNHTLTAKLYGNGTGGGNVNIDDFVYKNNWSHVVVTYNYDESNWTIYGNGEIYDSYQKSNSSGNLKNIYLGVNWKGLIDEVKIYGEALSPSKVSTIYNRSEYYDAKLNNEWTSVGWNTNYEKSSNIWMWADYSCSGTSTWKLYNPNISLKACCDDCDVCSDEI